MASDSALYAKARSLIDNVHMQDPLYVRRQEREAAQGAAAAAAVSVEGISVTGAEASSSGAGTAINTEGEGEDGQDELAYADAMEEWVKTLMEKAGSEADARLQSLPNGRALIRLAARCQHLERFATPRSTFPEGKAGYLQWRRTLYTKQADRAVDLMSQAGLTKEECTYVHTWVSKKDLKPGKRGGEWGTQMLEDAAVLVFLQDQLHHFALQHSGYTREKFVDILKKTWRKLSDEGKDAALGLDMPEPLKSIIEEAVKDPPSSST